MSVPIRADTNGILRLSNDGLLLAIIEEFSPQNLVCCEDLQFLHSLNVLERSWGLVGHTTAGRALGKPAPFAVGGGGQTLSGTP